jgi:hypothetical protein
MYNREHNTNHHISHQTRQDILAVCDILRIREQDFLNGAVEAYLETCQRQIENATDYKEEQLEDT